MKRLVTQNVTDAFGRVVGQNFGVWDSRRRDMVFLPHPRREKAEAFLAQGELEV